MNQEKAATAQNIELDYQKFFVWLKDKYGADRVYYFVGFMQKFQERYDFLTEVGYTLVFKEVVYSGGKAKGNCDADLVVHVMRDYYEGICKKAVIVSSDGDYAVLVKFLSERGALQTVISPAAPDKCSILLKRLKISMTFLNRIAEHFDKNKKAPIQDGT
ncbi:MAG: hypothetical protein A2848_01345 [Candidatus Magasanikbacteria bacterium RIFCSPHIGHO2_01_FULL_50_8]|uniref:NYN domain-containing protein n=2 Tax=Candidatus Magasanikiibacteriota TaxID=1752731 RepID=A0A1F6LS46_9BACT|nr:MAG: hypothetical protein A2848_01345 [Candidatus Magasanikbacteria bacterium RIFCSPHIGHO2_01_FULL_50_8]OGH67829.1 MAG: hypothetical protein A3C15_02095 [Candidatus Magasanikbacteria bacterium RIFCSPHIGHO2_02_FULL_50_9b]